MEKEIKRIEMLSEMLCEKARQLEKYEKEYQEWEVRALRWCERQKSGSAASRFDYHWNVEREPVKAISEADIEKLAQLLRKELLKLYKTA